MIQLSKTSTKQSCVLVMQATIWHQPTSTKQLICIFLVASKTRINFFCFNPRHQCKTLYIHNMLCASLNCLLCGFSLESQATHLQLANETLNSSNPSQILGIVCLPRPMLVSYTNLNQAEGELWYSPSCCLLIHLQKCW